MSWDDGLQGPAYNIAATSERRLRVVAGPGTGKSFALKRRVARLLEQGQDPSRVLAVTFIRNAAASLVDDLRGLTVSGCDKVRVLTLHSYCFRLLNHEEVFTFLDRIPRPIITVTKARSLQFEGGVLLSDLATDDEFADKRARAKRLQAFEAAWARLQSDTPGWPTDPIDTRFEAQLISWLRFHRAMLIGELVPQALSFLRNNPSSPELRAFDHILVDEYQDLNRAEQEIVDLLAITGSAAIVGDPDQSIYSFRFANPERIDEYSTRHSNIFNEFLVDCRRCPARVVTLANALIVRNYTSTPPRELRAVPGNRTGEVHIIQWTNSDNEASGLSDFVHHLLTERDYRPEDIMIITPRRKLAYQVRDAIADKDIDVHSFYQEEALEEESAQISFTLLTLLANPDDRVALRWWLGVGGQNDRCPSYRILRSYCEENGRSPREVLESIELGDLRLPMVSALSRRFRLLQDRICDLSALDLSALVDHLLPAEDSACTALRDIAKAGLSASANVSELFDNVRGFITQPVLPSGDYVRVMSPQKAKGLTSKVVIVASCIQGVLPILDDELPLQEQEAALAEQRRLFYVAITRCTDILVVSSFTHINYGLALNIGARVQRVSNYESRAIASRFISELGPTAPKSRSGSEWQASGYIDPVSVPPVSASSGHEDISE